MSALSGTRVVELGAIGPAPFAGMVLGDFGADVIRVDRVVHQDAVPGRRPHLLDRGKRSVAIDMKQEAGRALALALIDTADVVTEGYRPGVAERLGVGPDICLERNPRLIYGRMTGWGQDGPYADRSGHDLNYLAISGVLGALGVPESPPPPPLNLVGDFGGGGMLLALGIVLALFSRERSGRGQVVDASILDGVSLLSTTVADLRAGGLWEDAREANIMDGGAPFYRAYRCGDGRYVSVGAVEPQFYAALLVTLGLDPMDWPQYDRGRWAAQHAEMEAVFVRRHQAEWERIFSGVDACFAPVLSFSEAAVHPQTTARGTWVDAFGALQPAPAPKLSETPGRVRGPAPGPGEHTATILAELGVDGRRLRGLVDDQTVRVLGSGGVG